MKQVNIQHTTQNAITSDYRRPDEVNLICLDCRRSRTTTGGKVICLSIGIPELTYRYGKCRRFEPRQRQENQNGKPDKTLFD